MQKSLTWLFRSWAVAYLLMALVIIVLNIGEVPEVLRSIFANAFGLEEAVGGGHGCGDCARPAPWFVLERSRSWFGPEHCCYGKCSSPRSAKASRSRSSVFIDTILICSCTAFVILLGGVYEPGKEAIDGVVLTQQSLVYHLGDWTQYFLTFIILLFAFSSIIYNYYLGENAMSVITKNPMGIMGLRIAVMGIVFLGAVAPGGNVCVLVL